MDRPETDRNVTRVNGPFCVETRVRQDTPFPGRRFRDTAQSGFGMIPGSFRGRMGILGTVIVHTLFVQSEIRLMKNITLSADENLIEAARQRAAAERTTLNARFRLWLEDYVGRRRQADAAMATIDSLRASLSTGGRRFTRDEMNER